MTTPPGSAERLTAIESLDDLIVVVDGDLRVTGWNDAAVGLTGRHREDVLGKALLQLLAPESRADEARQLEKALKDGRVARHDTVFLKPDGTGMPVSVAIGRVEGPAPALLLLGHDLSVQHRIQLQLLHSKRMESTGHLAGGVAHEFNNILTAILALADFTVRELPEGPGPRDDIEEIRSQATKGARLVRHLLAFSRRQIRKNEVVHLGAICQEIEPLLQRFVSERVLIAIDASEDSRAVEVDRAQLELVLLELISNSSDAMEHGGSITINIRPVAIASDALGNGLPRGDYVQLTVQDTGIGIPAESTPRAVEPFFTTKGDRHTGLGLTMVDGIIRQHGGSVTIDSAEGQGTVVRILLPATTEAAEPDRDFSASPAKSQPAGETILVVEDENAVRQIICRSLRDRGYHILEAKNGEDALLVAERHSAPIHLVVTDVVMPEMGGAELYRLLRRWYPTMRILFISGYTKGAIPPEALEEGAGSGFLPKPFTLDQLAAEVRRMVDMPRRTPPPV